MVEQLCVSVQWALTHENFSKWCHNSRVRHVWSKRSNPYFRSSFATLWGSFCPPCRVPLPISPGICHCWCTVWNTVYFWLPQLHQLCAYWLTHVAVPGQAPTNMVPVLRAHLHCIASMMDPYVHTPCQRSFVLDEPMSQQPNEEQKARPATYRQTGRYRFLFDHLQHDLHSTSQVQRHDITHVATEGLERRRNCFLEFVVRPWLVALPLVASLIVTAFCT